MTAFEYVTGTLLLIVGLGVTQLLSRLVERFRNRHENRPHWIPLLWALLVFILQMQFLWSAFELSSLITTWTVSNFILLLMYALALFLAGALVLPRSNVKNNQDAFSYFLRDGRWSLIVLAFYQLWAFVFNPLLFGIKIFSFYNLMALPGIVILLVTFFGKSIRFWAIGTLLYFIYNIVLMVHITPGQYLQ